MNLIFDSSILIDNLRGGFKLDHLIKDDTKKSGLFLPTVVVMEIFAGTSSKVPERLLKIKNLLSIFEKISMSEKIAIKAGELYRDSKDKHEFPDYVVAATAIEIGGVVVTLNKKHFTQIPQIVIYPL